MNRKPETIRFYRKNLPHWEVSGGYYFITLHLTGAIPKEAAERIHEMSRALAKMKRDYEEARKHERHCEWYPVLDAEEGGQGADDFCVACGADDAACGTAEVARGTGDLLSGNPLSGELKRLMEEQLKLLELRRKIFKEMESWLDRASEVRYLAVPEVARIIMSSVGYHQRNKIWDVFEYVIMPNHIHFFTAIKAKGLEDSIRDFKHWTSREAGRIMGRSAKRFWQDECFDHWSRSWMQDIRIHQYIQRNPIKGGLVCDYRDWPYGSWSDKELQSIKESQKREEQQAPVPCLP
ncbi:MAG: transposase [Candidatus Sumerlaeota bacterium]|nr:transposase [Candidatus Sumerlaeota bacterium]